MTDMTTSKMGVEFIERHEGVVLRAYRDPAGVWTIGAGLTAASGVVRPRSGMTITADQAATLLALALRRNYEPAVRAAMRGTKQIEFDGATSFHFNTGAIGRASWVKAWKAHDWVEVHRRLALWRKGGGKVLPGLVRRREAEFRLMKDGVYGGEIARPTREGVIVARMVIDLSPAELAAIRDGFRRLGYDPGATAGEIARQAVLDFQKDHGLTADGLVGRATLSTLQRRLDARTRAAGPATVAVGGAAAETTPTDLAGLPDWASFALLAGAALWGLWLAWQYRDVIAAKLQGIAPRLADWLRSF